MMVKKPDGKGLEMVENILPHLKDALLTEFDEDGGQEPFKSRREKVKDEHQPAHPENGRKINVSFPLNGIDRVSGERRAGQ